MQRRSFQHACTACTAYALLAGSRHVDVMVSQGLQQVCVGGHGQRLFTTRQMHRERVIFENVRAANHGPLPDIELTHIYERIIDVMRALQKDELASRSKPGETGK